MRECEHARTCAYVCVYVCVRVCLCCYRDVPVNLNVVVDSPLKYDLELFRHVSEFCILLHMCREGGGVECVYA